MRAVRRVHALMRPAPLHGRHVSSVPGAFEGFPYEPAPKSVGTAEYEKLRANWAECVSYRHANMASPSSLEELQAVVRDSSSVRAVGSAHSFNHLSDVPGGTMVSLAYLANIHGIDVDTMTVDIEGGTTIGQLCRYLAPRGCALPNCASLPHITVAGAAATGTHGSGVGLQGVAGWVAEVEIVKADGSLARYSRDDPEDELFHGTVVNLGCLGVVSRMKVDIEVEYEVAQSVYSMPLEHYLHNFETLIRGSDSVSTFANFGDGVVEATFLRDKVDVGTYSDAAPFAPASTFEGGGQLVTEPVEIYESAVMHPSTGVGPWHDVLHFFMHSGRDDSMPYIGMQAEWFVPIEEAVPALRAAAAASQHWAGWGTSPLISGKAPVVIISELRQVAADDHWMSPSYQRESLCIHFTFGHHPREVMECVAEMEKALRPFAARPHWGKLFTPDDMTKDRVSELYPRHADFQALATEMDPEGKFQTDFTSRFIV